MLGLGVLVVRSRCSVGVKRCGWEVLSFFGFLFFVLGSVFFCVERVSCVSGVFSKKKL